MVEAFVTGDDYRFMVVNGQLVAAIRHDPPTVHGDGQHSVRDLISPAPCVQQLDDLATAWAAALVP